MFRIRLFAPFVGMLCHQEMSPGVWHAACVVPCYVHAIQSVVVYVVPYQEQGSSNEQQHHTAADDDNGITLLLLMVVVVVTIMTMVKYSSSS